MAVLGAGARVLFCEGAQDSLDRRLLGLLLDGSSDWTIVSAGTKSGLGRFAEGYLGSSGSRDWLAIRDRDFDQPPPSAPALLADPLGGPRIQCLYRTAVENYLLNPELLFRYWSGFTGGPYERRYSPLEDPDGIRRRVERASRAIAPYQAVRWALAGLRARQPRRLATTWTRGSGQLPVSLAWADCLAEAERLVAAVGAFDVDGLEREATALRDVFADRSFWEGGGDLIWFSGKDIAKQMQRQDPMLFPLKPYFDWSVSALDWVAHPDLVALRERLLGP